MKLRPRRRVPKTSDYVARELADEIIATRMSPGTMLPAEREMTEALGVGRATLREALRLLEARGVLRMKVGPGGGPVVRQPSASDLAEGLTLIMQFESGSLDDVVNARIALESTLVRSAADSDSGQLVERLSGINDELAGALEDLAAFKDAYQAFHNALAFAVGGSGVELFVHSIMAIVESQAPSLSISEEVRHGSHTAHSELIEAIATGDTQRSEEILARHVHDFYEPWRLSSPDMFSRPVRWAS